MSRKISIGSPERINKRALPFLHSHSGLERELQMEKRNVLVDLEFEELFKDVPTEIFETPNKTYLKVPIFAFVRKGGIFKNMYA